MKATGDLPQPQAAGAGSGVPHRRKPGAGTPGAGAGVVQHACGVLRAARPGRVVAVEGGRRKPRPTAHDAASLDSCTCLLEVERDTTPHQSVGRRPPANPMARDLALAEDEALLESFWFKYSGIATTNPDPWQFNPRKSYDNGEFWVVFEKCIAQVKDPAREAFVLRVLEDQTTEEVCKAMDITPNYLWVLLHRAREQLKILLESSRTGKDAQ